MTKNELLAFLKLITKTIKNMTEEEVKSLCSKSDVHKIILSNKDDKTINEYTEISTTKTYQFNTQKDVRINIIQKIKASENRESAIQILKNDENFNTKPKLIDLSKFLKLSVKKNDRKDYIERKIVENILGVNLRSKAIRSTKLG